MRRKKSKGEFGYMEAERRYVTLRTIILFIIPLVIFIAGYLYHDYDSKNIITVVAVLGCLPACKSMVNAIMFFRASGCSPAVREKIIEVAGEHTGCYDLYFTSYERNYPVSHMYLQGSLLCGYTEVKKCNCEAGEQHIAAMLKADGHKGITVKIYRELSDYTACLKTLLGKETETAEEKEVIYALLKNISL